MRRIASGWRHALALAAAAGVSTLAIPASVAVDVTVWAWDPNFNGAAMKEAASRFAALRPDITIRIDDSRQQDELGQELQTRLLTGDVAGLPDIVLIQDDVAQKYLRAFPGAFVALSDSIDMSQFASYKVAAATYESKSYSLPFDSGVTGLFYRSDTLAEAGYDSAAMQDLNWDGFIQIGEDVKARTGDDLIALDLNDAGLIRIMMQSAGAWYFNSDGSLNIVDNKPLKAALETYARIWRGGFVKPVSGWAESTGAFISGETAAVLNGVWMTGTIKSNPDQAGRWAVAPIPKLDGVEGATSYSNEGGSSWYVLTPGAGKDAAIDFLKTIWASDVGFYQTILLGQGAFSTWLPASAGGAYTSSDAFFGGQPVWASFSDWQARIPSVDYGIYTAEVDSAVAAQLPAIARGGSVDEALNAIDEQARKQVP